MTHEIGKIIDEILKSEPITTLMDIHSTAVFTGRAPQYTGKLLQDVFREALTTAQQMGRESVFVDIEEMRREETYTENACPIVDEKAVAFN